MAYGIVRTRDLTGSRHTAVEVSGESLAEVLAAASVKVARQEHIHEGTGVLYNDGGAVRVYHAENDEGHQVIIFFEGWDE